MAARKKDLLPEAFESIEEAGNFWDTHSLADYKDQVRAVDLDLQITKRTRYITVPEKIYKKLAVRAGRQHRTVRQMVAK
jgi:hypothetical protein